MKKRLKYFISGIIFILLVGLAIGGYTYYKNYNEIESNKVLSNSNEVKEDGGKENQVNEAEKTDENEKEVVEDRIESIDIAAVGDFLMHMPIINGQYDYANGKYDFSYNFQYVKEYLSDADLTIANLETTFAGADVGYCGYPAFNCPDELAENMKEIGIDVVSDMSNHTLDEGESGFIRTRQVLSDAGLDIIGSRDSDKDKRYIIEDVKGIKVGITCYSYTTEDEEGTLGLNGIPISQEMMCLINVFNQNHLEDNFLDMKEQVEEMRREGVDVIIFYMHWGEEYQLEPNETQIQIAQYLADCGVDIIFGDHPHTIQPIEMLSSSDGTRETAVIYSLGNFISCQRSEYMDNNPYTEDGLIVNVNITKNFTTGDVTVNSPTYIPTWVKDDTIDGVVKYTVVATDNDTADYLSDYQRQEVESSYARTSEIVESLDQSINVFSEVAN